MRTFLIVAVLGALLVGALVLGIRSWTGLGDVAMPWQGWLALTLGVVFTLALGVGLMGLVFYSARHGHDDTQYIEQPDIEQPDIEQSDRGPESEHRASDSPSSSDAQDGSRP